MSRQLTFGGSAGEGSVECLNMTLINDKVSEVDEDFTVLVEPVSDFITTASPSSATFTIEDDDCETYTVSLLHLNQCLFLFPETVLTATQWSEQNLRGFVYTCLPNRHLHLSQSML